MEIDKALERRRRGGKLQCGASTLTQQVQESLLVG
ncbi:MAG: hypothetical protein IPP90_21185 [Gemmatimonadaceae bacterium]|nr:hypothetical protein [Gemmatimonadaceae bacterium]